MMAVTWSEEQVELSEMRQTLTQTYRATLSWVNSGKTNRFGKSIKVS